MPLQLEVLPALWGDSLLLHYGPPKKRGLVVIDGGPRGVWSKTLRRRLLQIKEKRSPDAPLPIRLVMVSHIDDDHIRGILDMADELADTSPGQRPFEVEELWHNAFNDVVADDAQELLRAGAAEARVSSTGEVPAAVRTAHPGAAVIASVPQGRKLRDHARKLGWVVNDERPLLVAGSGSDTIAVDSGLEMTLLGPSSERIAALQKLWQKELKKAKPSGAKVVEFADKEPTNLSSLVLLATDGKKKILLTGDARGDYILEGVEAAKLVKKGKLAVDVLKVPHHGSIRNLEPVFFETIVAKHYVISANGKYKNPDIASLEMLLAARGNDDYTIHLTYPVEEFAEEYDRKALQKLIGSAAGKIKPRDPKKGIVL